MNVRRERTPAAHQFTSSELSGGRLRQRDFVPIPADAEGRIKNNLTALYGESVTPRLYGRLVSIAQGFKTREPSWLSEKNERVKAKGKATEKDSIFITYADSIKNGGAPLASLGRFAKSNLNGVVSDVHILPHYKWDKDGGFSIIDYEQVDPRYGDWGHIAALREDFDLMFDFVANHASLDNHLAQGALIQRALHRIENSDEEAFSRYKDFVIAFSDDQKPSDEQFAALERPRTTPVLTRYFVTKEDSDYRAVFDEPVDTEVIDKGWVWTTFSRPDADGKVDTRQVDLNYDNPEVLVEMTRIMFKYIELGAGRLRYDAIGYIKKAVGKKSFHEPEVHRLMQVWCDLLQSVAPGVVNVAEVVDMQANAKKYLGQEDAPEADEIYNFAAFPLGAHALSTGSNRFYMDWIRRLQTDGTNGRHLLPITGTHDGMFQNPVRAAGGEPALLPEEELVQWNKKLEKEHGALFVWGVRDGEKVGYEACITPWNAVNPRHPDNWDNLDEQTKSIEIKRYLALVALGLSVRGVPALYINGLLGTANHEGPLDENRSINRQPLNEQDIMHKLGDPGSKEQRVFSGIVHLLQTRQQEAAFNPLGPDAETVPLNKAVVSVLLASREKNERVLSLVNVSDKEQLITIHPEQLGMESKSFPDLLTGLHHRCANGMITLTLEPYQAVWLKDQSQLNP